MIIDAALRAAASGPYPLALVTVARVEGSAPRHSGSRMAVFPDGAIVGTVGGGKPEARSREEALAALRRGSNGTLKIEMTGAEARGADLICGGVVEIWIEVVLAGGSYAAAAEAIDSGRSVLIAASASEGCLAVFDQEGGLLAGGAAALDGEAALDAASVGAALKAEFPAIGPKGILYQLVEPRERLLILGGGHVGLALAREAERLSFGVSVADPRPEFSDASRFPAGVECRTQDFVEAIASFPFGSSAYVVIVSPGHLGDLECARAVLAREYRYAGFIGSRRKTRMLIEELVAEGFERAKVEALRAPIGLDIGAETPEEIAVAIAAELIAVRRRAATLAWIDEDRKRRRGT